MPQDELFLFDPESLKSWVFQSILLEIDRGKIVIQKYVFFIDSLSTICNRRIPVEINILKVNRMMGQRAGISYRRNFVESRSVGARFNCSKYRK